MKWQRTKQVTAKPSRVCWSVTSSKHSKRGSGTPLPLFCGFRSRKWKFCGSLLKINPAKTPDVEISNVDVLAEQETEELIAGNYIIRWTSVLSNRFDTTNFKKVYGDLYKAFTKQTASRRFFISC